MHLKLILDTLAVLKVIYLYHSDNKEELVCH